RYDLLAHESDILRLHFWERAFELLKAAGALRLETDGKNKGCWVLTMEGTEGSLVEKPEGTTSAAPERDSLPRGANDEESSRGRPSSATAGRRIGDEDKIIVRSNGTVTYTGKDIAYQLWKLGRLDRDFRYRRHRTEPDGHVLWTTTSGDGEAGAPVFGHAAAVYNVIDVGQSYPQRVVKAGGAAAPGPRGAAAGPTLRHAESVGPPPPPPALAVAATAWPRTKRRSRCPAARGWESRPTTSWTRWWPRPARRSTPATPSARRTPGKRRPARSPWAPCATSS